MKIKAYLEQVIMKLMNSIFSIILLCFSGSCIAAGNETNQSFSKAKKDLEQTVYQDHRETIYCAAVFDNKKNIAVPVDLKTEKHKTQAKQMEWVHVVPAENFGRSFSEWRSGNRGCVDRKGMSFKGRKCAEKINTEYRYMQADMHNLFPAIDTVNVIRSNYNFAMLPAAKSELDSCDMKIDNRKAEPPISSRGRIARTYIYMDQTYPSYTMSKKQRQLMNLWDREHPVSTWECKRNRMIWELQGNPNRIVERRCLLLWM
nr:endonuclease [Moritella sp. 24]